MKQTEYRNLFLYILLALSPIGIILPFIIFGSFVCDVSFNSIKPASVCVTPSVASYYNSVTTFFTVSSFFGGPFVWLPAAGYIWYRVGKQVMKIRKINKLSKIPPKFNARKIPT